MKYNYLPLILLLVILQKTLNMSRKTRLSSKSGTGPLQTSSDNKNMQAIAKLKQKLDKERKLHFMKIENQKKSKIVKERIKNRTFFQKRLKKSLNNIADFDLLKSFSRKNRDRKNRGFIPFKLPRKLVSGKKRSEKLTKLSNLDILRDLPDDFFKNTKVSFFLNYNYSVSRFSVKKAMIDIVTLIKKSSDCHKIILDQIDSKVIELGSEFNKAIFDKIMDDPCKKDLEKLSAYFWILRNWLTFVMLDVVINDSNAVKYISSIKENGLSNAHELSIMKQTIAHSAFLEFLKANKEKVDLQNYLGYYKSDIKLILDKESIINKAKLRLFISADAITNLKSNFCKLLSYMNTFKNLNLITNGPIINEDLSKNIFEYVVTVDPSKSVNKVLNYNLFLNYQFSIENQIRNKSLVLESEETSNDTDKMSNLFSNSEEFKDLSLNLPKVRPKKLGEEINNNKKDLNNANSLSIGPTEELLAFNEDEIKLEQSL